MATTPIQTSSAANNAVAFGVNVTAGSRIVVITFNDTAAAVVSIADTLVNTFSLVKKQLATSGFWPCEIWLSDAASAAGADTVVVTFDVGVGNPLVIITEIPNLVASPAGTPIGANNAGSANPSIGSLTPAATGDIVIVACANVNNKIATAGSGFTIPANGTINGSGNGLMFEYDVAPSTSAITCALTMASSQWNGCAVSLAAAGGAATPSFAAYYQQHYRESVVT